MLLELFEVQRFGSEGDLLGPLTRVVCNGPQLCSTAPRIESTTDSCFRGRVFGNPPPPPPPPPRLPITTLPRRRRLFLCYEPNFTHAQVHLLPPCQCLRLRHFFSRLLSPARSCSSPLQCHHRPSRRSATHAAAPSPMNATSTLVPRAAFTAPLSDTVSPPPLASTPG